MIIRMFFLGIPMAEQLAFILTTLLSDIAIITPDKTEQQEIIGCQLEVLQRLTESITDSLKTKMVDEHKKGQSRTIFISGF